MKKLSVLLGGVLLAVWGCGGSSSSGPAVSVSLNLTAANVHLLRTKQFTATVVNATNSAVTWSVSGADCSGAQAACGTVTSTGLYTAPSSRPNPATVTVTATSMADSSKSASATLTILASVTISVGPASQSVNVGATQQYAATVQNAIDNSVTWSVTGTGCTGAACGTISSAGLYSAPTAVPNPGAITVTAASVEDPLTIGSAPATVTASVTISSWPARALVATSTTYQFGLVQGGPSAGAVTWSLSGAGCTGTTCGTINPDGLYTAPASVPSPETVTVTVTSQVDPSKTATSVVTLRSSSLGKLNGVYAYLYQGFVLNAPATTAGVFVADGQGNLSQGVGDRTCPDSVGGNLTSASFTGTYQVGADNRGFLYLHGPAIGDVTLAFALDAAGDMAFVQPFMDASTRLLGRFVKMDLPVPDNSAIQGDYVFQWLGADVNGNRLGALGKLHANGYGTITTGSVDINDRTSVQQDLALSGTYSVSLNGRATMTLTVASVGTIHLLAYVLAPDRFFMTSIDPVTTTAPMWSGTAFEQSGGPFSNASLQGTGVFDLLGRPATAQAVTSLGLMTGDANGNLSGLFDSNTNGTVTTSASYAATCSIRSDGRGALTSTTIPNLEFYLVSPGKALLMGSGGVAVDLGFLEPQAAMAYSTPALAGQYAESAPTAPVHPAHLTLTAAASYDASGDFTYNMDVNSSVAGLVSAWGNGLVTSMAANGRGVLGDSAGNHSYLYMISPMSFIVLEGYIPQQTMADQNLLYRNIR
jgi:hypothetical protein